MIRTAFGKARLGGDFGVIAMVRVLIGLLVVGGRRLEHLKYTGQRSAAGALRACTGVAERAHGEPLAEALHDAER